MTIRDRGRRPGTRTGLVPGLAVCLAGCLGSLPVPEDYGRLPAFALTERSGKRFDSTQLDGKVWVAGFVFTRCAGPCPVVTGGMARVAAKFHDEPDVRLVTITVDPAFDTPAVLTDYARRFSADPDRWYFLTGAQPEVYQLILNGFRLGVEHKGSHGPPGDEVTHTTKLAVIDRHGHVRGYFDGTDATARARLIETVRALLKEAR